MRCLYFIILLLLLTISHFKVNSVPIREKQQMVNKRGVDTESENIKNSIVKESKMVYELSNVSISSYLKDLYANSTFLRGRDYGVTATQTIRSYKNQANSKLHE